MFSLIRALFSPTSAEDCSRLFGWFIGTTARYQALEAISIAAPDELIRRAITVRKRFTGLGEAEDYQTAAAAFERSVPPVARKPAAKEEGAEIQEAA